jgi:Fe-S-cluster containining protein
MLPHAVRPHPSVPADGRAGRSAVRTAALFRHRVAHIACLRYPDRVTYECDLCGACCRQLAVEAYAADVMREPKLAAGQRMPYARFIEYLRADAERCLVLTSGGPCLFLEGNRCSIHATRPNACVAVQAGDHQCRQARAQEALPPLAPKP